MLREAEFSIVYEHFPTLSIWDIMVAPQIILGIDPGLCFSGFSILNQQGGKTSLLSCGYLPLKSSDTVSKRIKLFYDFFNDLIVKNRVTAIALERPFLGKNVDSFLKLGYLRGLIHLLSEQHALPLHEFLPRQVKMAITGYGGAPKDQLARVIGQLFPTLPVIKKADVTDAIAISLCCAWQKFAVSYDASILR